jgi:hypothetical protein
MRQAEILLSWWLSPAEQDAGENIEFSHGKITPQFYSARSDDAFALRVSN